MHLDSIGWSRDVITSDRAVSKSIYNEHGSVKTIRKTRWHKGDIGRPNVTETPEVAPDLPNGEPRGHFGSIVRIRALAASALLRPETADTLTDPASRANLRQRPKLRTLR